MAMSSAAGASVKNWRDPTHPGEESLNENSISMVISTASGATTPKRIRWVWSSAVSVVVVHACRTSAHGTPLSFHCERRCENKTIM